MPAPERRQPTVGPAPPRLTYLVKQLELAVRADLDAIVAAVGVTVSQFTALSVLGRHPGISGAQLARRSFVSPQAGSEMIAVLERKGLARRSTHEGNRRVLRIDLTPEGRALLGACDQAVDALEHQMVARLTVAQIRGFRQALSTCVGSFAPTGGAARQKPGRVS